MTIAAFPQCYGACVIRSSSFEKKQKIDPSCHYLLHSPVKRRPRKILARRFIAALQRLAITFGLHPEQARIDSLTAEQLLVTSHLCNPAVLEHDDAVGHAHRRKAM